MFVFDESVREFNPGDGRMRCAAGVAAIVRMGPLSIKSRRVAGEDHMALLPLGVSSPGRVSSLRHQLKAQQICCEKLLN